MPAELEQQGFIKKCEAAPKPQQPEQLLEKAVEAVLEGMRAERARPGYTIDEGYYDVNGDLAEDSP